MNTSKMKHTKLFFLLITTLTTVSCHQSTNESSSESSASDSVELKKQEVWESAHRLDSMGNHREALLLRERTLSEYCPNSADFAKATQMCDMALRDSLDINMVTIKAFVLTLMDGDRSTRHFLDSLSIPHYDSEALQQLKESTEDIRNVVKVIKSLK